MNSRRITNNKIYKNNEKTLSEYISKIIYVDVDLIDEINKEVKRLNIWSWIRILKNLII